MYKTDENPRLFRWKIFDQYSHLVNIAVTGRFGGVSKSPYGDFNLALHTEDRISSVLENRSVLCSSQNIDFNSYTCAEQTHSANIHVVNPSQAGKGKETYDNSIAETDALIVMEKNIMINIHLADCVPIALFDFNKKIGALIHAGWKGTARQITRKTIEYMISKLNCSAESILLGIGPSIGACCYEIGQDTAEKLSAQYNYSGKVILKKKGIITADLKQANLEQAISAGLKEGNIEKTNICTKCSIDDFFSYRGESGTTGRFSTFLTLL